MKRYLVFLLVVAGLLAAVGQVDDVPPFRHHEPG